MCARKHSPELTSIGLKISCWEMFKNKYNFGSTESCRKAKAAEGEGYRWVTSRNKNSSIHTFYMLTTYDSTFSERSIGFVKVPAEQKFGWRGKKKKKN